MQDKSEKFTQMFSVRLIGRRNHQGLSQTELAARTGVSLRTIQNWEGGDHVPYGHSLRKLAATLGVEMPWLMGEELEASQSVREESTAYGKRAPEPAWAADLVARLELFAPEQRQRVIRSLHLVMDGFLSSQSPFSYQRADQTIALPRLNSDPRSSAGMEAAALTAAAMVGHNPPAAPPPLPKAVSTSERRSAPATPAPRGSSRESKPPVPAPASRGNPN